MTNDSTDSEKKFRVTLRNNTTLTVTGTRLRLRGHYLYIEGERADAGASGPVVFAAPREQVSYVGSDENMKHTSSSRVER